MKIIPLRFFWLHLLFWAVSTVFLVGCAVTAEGRPGDIWVEIQADGRVSRLEVAPNTTVGQALQKAKLSLGQLDRVEPPLVTPINEPTTIIITRVKEAFEVERIILPFEQKVVQTESLPEQVNLLAQKGQNGEAEITYRILYEDGVEVSRTMVNEMTILKEPVPEIIMVGVQKPLISYDIPGRLAYLLGGNAWLIDGNTANRKLVVNTGDLDGRVFRLSQDGKWLLFTRRENEEGQINSLWAAHLVDLDNPTKLINLKVKNIVHFADWVPLPGALRVYFSTVEPRNTAPGWQANNNLLSLDFSPNGWVSKLKTIVETNSGGVYGWWGTQYALAPNGEQIAFARPDGVGVLLDDGTFDVLLNLTPYQTGADWAWVPGLTWSPNGKFLYTVDHLPEEGLPNQEESKSFAVTALSLNARLPIHLVRQTGMFASPIPSPIIADDLGQRYRLAYLQAKQPEQSEVSRYQLMVMDQDGSDTQVLFPQEGEAGLEPQIVCWSPAPMSDTGLYAIAVIYQGNLYLVDVPQQAGEQSKVRQISGDGLVSRVVWSFNQ
jgi:hypothetical protein